jgi:N-methylhydantoinase A
VVIPQAPGHFSAAGMLMADWRRDAVRTVFADLDEISMTELEGYFRELERIGANELLTSAVSASAVLFERTADMRYVGQEHSVTVRLPAGVALDDETARATIKQLFDATHDRRYGHSAAAEPAQIVSVRVSTVGRLQKPHSQPLAEGGPLVPDAARLGTRTVTFPGWGPQASSVFQRDRLVAGNVIKGPAIIQEPASTTPVGPDETVRVGRLGELVMTIGQER